MLDIKFIFQKNQRSNQIRPPVHQRIHQLEILSFHPLQKAVSALAKEKEQNEDRHINVMNEKVHEHQQYLRQQQPLKDNLQYLCHLRVRHLLQLLHTEAVSMTQNIEVIQKVEVNVR